MEEWGGVCSSCTSARMLLKPDVGRSRALRATAACVRARVCACRGQSCGRADQKVPVAILWPARAVLFGPPESHETGDTLRSQSAGRV